MTEPWLNVDGIAQHLGVASVTIYRWLEKKSVPAHRVGKLWKFKATEVDEWVKNGGASLEGISEIGQSEGERP